MMRITMEDVKSLTFACVMLGAVAEQTLDADKRQQITKHKDRIRKMYLILLNTSVQGIFNPEDATQHGVPDNSVVAKGIRSLCPKAEPESNAANEPL
jgi:hypothetical protein